ncbi:MAG: hypothetical protein ILO36_04315 [Abditibacteriota bacterium]|nr:hypothetical protein [Abditibacteriota bacterium]
MSKAVIARIAKERAEWIKNAPPSEIAVPPRKCEIPETISAVTVSDHRPYGKETVFRAGEAGREEEKPGIMRTAGRLPDLRLYFVREYRSAGYIKYDCDFAPPRTAESVNIILTTSEDYDYRDHFTCAYTRAPDEVKWKLLDPEPFGAGLTLYRYDIAKEARKLAKDINKRSDGTWFYMNPFKSVLSALKTKEGALVWASATAAPLSVMKKGDGYIVVTDKETVEYVYYEDGIPSVDVYDKEDYSPYIWFVTDEGLHPVLKSGRMLTDNIVRLEYDNGLVIHKKVKLAYEDARANADNGREASASIVWHSRLKDKGIRLGLGKYIMAKGFSDYPNEPVYE